MLSPQNPSVLISLKRKITGIILVLVLILIGSFYLIHRNGSLSFSNLKQKASEQPVSTTCPNSSKIKEANFTLNPAQNFSTSLYQHGAYYCLEISQPYGPSQAFDHLSIDSNVITDRDTNNILSTEDLNFDENNDLSLLYSLSANGDAQNYYWLYDESKHQFIYRSDLSEYRNVSADPDKKTISSFIYQGCAKSCYSEYTYQWKADSLEVIKVVEQVSNGDSMNSFTRTTSELKDGILQQTNVEKLRINHADELVPY